MKTEVIRNLEDFLNDFQYKKLQGYDAFYQSFDTGHKLIVLNITPYEKGIMLEVQLAIKFDKVEEILFNFRRQNAQQLSLTFWINLDYKHSSPSKRIFIENRVEVVKVLNDIEHLLVTEGFVWLDKMSNLKFLSNEMLNIIFSKSRKPINLFRLCQRSYLIRLILKEHMTESIFYHYYEVMQVHKVPEHQLEEFRIFRKYLDSFSF